MLCYESVLMRIQKAARKMTKRRRAMTMDSTGETPEAQEVRMRDMAVVSRNSSWRCEGEW